MKQLAFTDARLPDKPARAFDARFFSPLVPTLQNVVSKGVAGDEIYILYLSGVKSRF